MGKKTKTAKLLLLKSTRLLLVIVVIFVIATWVVLLVTLFSPFVLLAKVDKIILELQDIELLK